MEYHSCRRSRSVDYSDSSVRQLSFWRFVDPSRLRINGTFGTTFPAHLLSPRESPRRHLFSVLCAEGFVNFDKLCRIVRFNNMWLVTATGVARQLSSPILLD